MRSVVATIFRGAVRLLIFSLFSAIFLNAGGAAELSPSELRPLAARLFDSPPLQITVGPVKGEPPAQGVFRNGHLIGYLASTWTIARSVGYSGKPIDILVAVDGKGVLRGAHMVAQSEPVLILGISHEDLAGFVSAFSGLDLKAPLKGADGAQVSGIPQSFSGATVSSAVMRGAILRTARAIASSRGIIAGTATQSLAPATFSKASWDDLIEEGAIARRHITVGEANQALGVEAQSDDGGTFVELFATLLTPPRIGQNLLGPIAYSELAAGLGPDDHAILVAGNGLYSFKGTSYRKSGTFDRIELIQGTQTIRLGAANYRNVRQLGIAGAPALREIGQFVIPGNSGFKPAEPWQINLIATRDLAGGAVAVAEFALPFRLPPRYVSGSAEAPAPAASLYWLENWQSRVPGIIVITVMLAVLSAILVFQDSLSERFRLYRIVRLSYLAATLFLIGWWLGAQLSVVHVISFVQALLTGFSWELFLLDPFVFILWSFVGVALLFWGRGVFCGWLCPFGALQELLNELARKAGLKQINVNFALHERLWPIKYILFLGLFAVSLNSVTAAFTGAEIEPFKTVITLKFMRQWPFVLFALGILVLGLVIERFYCRYLCPLGAALAIPARLRMFDWLKRRKQCGTECGVCARRCTVQAIHPNGSINPNECINCLNCQMLYYDERTCPPLIERAKRRQRREEVAARREADSAGA
ncbi:MAG: regulatory protein NosR [Rhodobiaceae bacterium]|nr:regulatory protein NosR [Rhodobiaceae bacterium]